MLQARFLIQRLYISLIATVIALCLLLVTTMGALANTVNISDAAHVLNTNQVRTEAANLPDPISIFTTNTFTGTTTDFDQRTRSYINSPNLIVMAIDTVHHHLAIVGGSNVPLSDSQYNDAVQAFINSYNSSNGDNYTNATIAAIRSIRSALGAAPVPSGNNPGGNVPISSSGGFFPGFGTLTLCCIGLMVLGIVAVIFGVTRRRARLGQPVMEPPYQQPYNQPYNQGYPPTYGPGYSQGGMNPWAAGGLGAAAGGFIGYELGKEEGEEQARDQDQGGGNDFGGGASGDFGGGNAGDFGGGAGGDFGGGGGGDFGGGSSGNF